MESKKVISCEFKRERTDKYGLKYDFAVKFEGDDKQYQYTTTDKNKPYFVAGETAQFDTEEKSGDREDGTKWTIYKAKPVKQEFSGKGGGYRGKTKIDFLCDNLSFQSSYIKDLILGDKIKIEEFDKMLEERLKFTEAKIRGYLSE